MTAPELRQEIIDAMKSVAWCDKPESRQDAIEVEADTLMDAIEKYMTAQQGRTEANDEL